MLGDLILTIVQAFTTLSRAVRPSREPTIVEELIALPRLHFATLDPMDNYTRHEAWLPRFVMRTKDDGEYMKCIAEGMRAKERFKLRPGLPMRMLVRPTDRLSEIEDRIAEFEAKGYSPKLVFPNVSADDWAASERSLRKAIAARSGNPRYREPRPPLAIVKK